MYDISDQDRFGYYLTSNNRKFYNKLECILFCESQGLDFRWVFNDEYYDKVNWSVEPTLTIGELYARRARELREKYDYLILHLSGGNDSGAILETFALNDILLDEVVVCCPETSLINNPNPNDRSAANTFAEISLCAIPNAQYVKDHFQPGLRITVHEFQKISMSKLSTSDWFESGHNDLDAGGKYRSNFNLLDPRYRNMHDQGKTVAHIDGVEKPRLVVTHNQIGIIFEDSAVHRRSPSGDQPNEFCYTEHFFWAPSCAEMICKQGHLILNTLRGMPDGKQVAIKLLMQNHATRFSEDWVAKLIYPNRLLPKWDTEKSENPVIREWHQWFNNAQDMDFFKNWKMGMDHLNTVLPKKYLKSNSIYHGGFKHKLSKLRILGNI
jgi:hypothetical protein